MKYYIGQIEVKCGEYEFTNIIRFQLEDGHEEEAPGEHLDKIASGFYGDNPEDSEDFCNGYSFNNGEVYVETGIFREISKESFEELDGLVTEL